MLFLIMTFSKNKKTENWKDMEKLGKPDYLDNRLSFILY